MTEFETMLEGLRTRAEARRHLNQPMEVRPSEILALLDALQPPAAPAEEQPAEEQPAEEQTAEEQPAEEQTAEEQPAEEQTAEEQPAEEQPQNEQPQT